MAINWTRSWTYSQQGFIAQLVLHWYHRSHGFESHFLGFLCNCFSCFITVRITFTSIAAYSCLYEQGLSKHNTPVYCRPCALHQAPRKQHASSRSPIRPVLMLRKATPLAADSLLHWRYSLGHVNHAGQGGDEREDVVELEMETWLDGCCEECGCKSLTLAGLHSVSFGRVPRIVNLRFLCAFSRLLDQVPQSRTTQRHLLWLFHFDFLRQEYQPLPQILGTRLQRTWPVKEANKRHIWSAGTMPLPYDRKTVSSMIPKK